MNQSESISQRLAEKVEWRRRKRRLRRRDLTPESLEIERLKRRAYYSNNKENASAHARKYYTKNRERLLEYQKCYSGRVENKASIYEIKKSHAIRNREKIKARLRDWKIRNADKLNASSRGRYRTDIQYRITVNLRNALYAKLKSKSAIKTESALSLIGCTVDFLKNYMATKFTAGMSWENHGAWHIDHIIPCKQFDLLKLDQRKACFHYSNLQPLWKLDNLLKRDTTPPPHQAQLL